MPPITPRVVPPDIASIIPPVSAAVVWTLPTDFEVIRCLAWEESENSWRIAVVFGKDTIKVEHVTDLETLWGAAELLWRCLASSSDSLTSAMLNGAPPGARRTRARRRRPELARSTNG